MVGQTLIVIGSVSDIAYITTRASRLGWSAYKMNDIKRYAVKKSLAVQFRVNWGKQFGGNVMLLALTADGYRLLGKEPVEKPGNVDWPHWWWQGAICGHFNRKGIKAEIEKSRNGKRADVVLVVNGAERAVEVEMGPMGVPNIVQDLQAGFERVYCCCKDSAIAREIIRRLRLYEGYESIKDKVEVRVLSDLQLVKEICGK